jgi:hypothetical protein
MPYSFVFYPDPSNASFVVKPDGGGAFTSVPYTYTDGRQGGCAYLDDNTANKQGALLQITADGYEPWEARGFLQLYADTMIARLEVDDANLKPLAAAPTPPPAGSSPMDIINHVYATTQPQLWTHAGCGKFTEDCCTALHNGHSAYWGHVRKTPGQNQFNEHAVDAVHLALNVPGCNAGIYDIIFSSVSAEAKPVFNLAGPPEFDLWYYPAAPIDESGGARSSEPVPVLVLRMPDHKHR